MPASDSAHQSLSDVSLFFLILFFLGFVLTATVVPGIFTVDENNYLVNVVALRQGHVTLANTRGLTPSRELLFFDPGPWSRSVNSTPVASTAPPLYAPVALPFSYFGWRGLVALNTLSYLATTGLVFLWVRRYSAEKAKAWLGAAAYALAGFSIEYAQGLWPHALSVALCTGGTLAAGDAIERRSERSAILSGFLLALATGVRYQNAVILGTVGVAVLWWCRSNWRAICGFATASMIPIALSSIMNYNRLGLWNPVSKGTTGYLSVPIIQNASSSWRDPFIMFWARVADFSARPVPFGRQIGSWYVHEPVTGANLMLGITLKKALLQSAPWAIIALAFLLMSWWPKSNDRRTRQLRLLALVTFSVLALFAISGVNREDGFSFNQRYLLEIVPVAAIAFALALDGIAIPLRPLLVGSVAGAAIAAVILVGTPTIGDANSPRWIIRLMLLLRLPLYLAAMALALWLVTQLRQRYCSALAAVVGVCLGWAFSLHFGDDVLRARDIRRYHLQLTNTVLSVVPQRSAVVTYWGLKEPTGPVLLDRDVVIIAAGADDGMTASSLVHDFLRAQRRVFLIDEGFPQSTRQIVLDGLETRSITDGPPRIAELRQQPQSQ